MEDLKCPICGNVFIAPLPGQWAYKKGKQLFCRYSCLRAFEMKKGEDTEMKTKIPDEIKQEAVRTALDGGNPIKLLAPYTKNQKAMWWAVKAKLKETDPETYARIPNLRNIRETAKEEKPVTAADAMAACQDAADTFFGQCQDMGLLKDQAAESEPEMEYKVTGIRTGLGNFQYYKKTGFIDWTPNDGNDTASLNLDEWKQFINDWPKVLKVLGVKE